MGSFLNNMMGQMQPMVGTGSGGMPQGDADFTQDPYGVPGQSTPGMGGKAGGGRPNPFSQVPVDMQGYLLQPGANDFMSPPAPTTPLGVEQGGTPGRPVPAAPMSPRGPGFANPGGPGVGTPGMGGKSGGGQMPQPMPRPEIQPMPAPPMTAPGPMVNPRSRVSMQAPQSMKQGIMGRGGMGMGKASRGAGRGGMIR